MSCTLILKRTFPELESCLLHDLETSCARDPFSRKWVLTSSGTLARHIRKRLEEKVAVKPGLTLGGLRIVSISYFASELHKKIWKCHSAYGQPINNILLDALVTRIPDYSPLAKVKSIDSGFSLLMPTFRDLADAGFGPFQSELVMDAVSEEGVSDRERKILELYFFWVEELKSKGIEWSPLCQQELAEWLDQASISDVSSMLSAEGGKPCELFIHGFYDFTDNNLQLAANLSRTQSMRLYFPDNRAGKDPHPAFDFSDSVLQDIRIRVKLSDEADIEDSDDEGEGLQAVPMADYLDRTFPEGLVDDPPDFITFQKASSPRAEAISAALQVRRWVDELGIDPEEVMVVLTSPGEYLAPAREAFSSFCLPVNLLDCPVAFSEKQMKLSLLYRLWKEDAQAEWIFQFLRDNPGFCEDKGINPDHFESELRKINFGGGSRWREIRELQGLKIKKLRQFPDLAPAELRLAGLIVDTWVDKPEFPISALKAGELLCRISAWTRGEDFFEEVLDSLELWAGFQPDYGITENLFVTMVFNSAYPEKTGSDVSRPGVKLVPMMRARGLTCRAIVFLGLSSGDFPRKAEEDYFLGDSSRVEVSRRAGALGHRLPVKSRLTDEMALLFYLLNTSAERVHWVVPETDSSGRLVTPTSWIQHFVQHWEKNQPEFLGRIAPSPTDQARFLKNLDPQKGFWLPPDLAFLLGSGQAARLFDFPDNPLKRRKISDIGNLKPEFFGLVRDAGCEGQEKVIGVTSLQSLAKCPYMFYAESVLKAAPLEAQVFPYSINPMEKGSLLHSCLERLFQGSREVAAAAREYSVRVEAVRSIVWDILRDSLNFGFLPVTLRKVFSEQLVGIILEYLRFAAGSTPSGRKFESFETRLVKPFPGLEGVVVKGIADRIDRDSSTRKMWIMDYKSGANNDLTGRKKSLVLDLGWMAQASLYQWMVDNPEEEDVRFHYIFLGEGEKKEVPADPSVRAEELLGSMKRIISEGAFLPVSNSLMEEMGMSSLEPCGYCCYMSMCRRIDPEQMRKGAALFRKICPERAKALEAAALKLK
jgi:RecB family exonuclease